MKMKLFATLLTCLIPFQSFGQSSQIDKKVELIIKQCKSSDHSRPVLNYSLIVGEVFTGGVGVYLIKHGLRPAPGVSQDDISAPTGSTVTIAAALTELGRRKLNLMGTFDENELRSLSIDLLTETEGVEITKIRSLCKTAFRSGVNVDCQAVIDSVKQKVMDGVVCERESLESLIDYKVRN